MVRDDIQPWDRQKGETHKAYEAFWEYCRLGPKRSLTKTSQSLHKSREMLGEWSRKWHWVERSRQYDSYLVRAEIEESREAIKKMRQNQITTGKFLQSKALEALKTKAESGNGLTSEEVKDLLTLIVKGAEMEEHARLEGLNTLTGGGADQDDILERAREILGGVDSVIK